MQEGEDTYNYDSAYGSEVQGDEYPRIMRSPDSLEWPTRCFRDSQQG